MGTTMNIKNEIHTPEYRILDANYNRVREAFRVVEEYFRFIKDDSRLSLRAKEFRHTLNEAWEKSSVRRIDLVPCRDTEGDVGTALSTKGETSRRNNDEVFYANLSRAQEGLRVLEEYSKRFDNKLAKNMKALRYKVYELEKESCLIIKKSDILKDRNLYVLVTHALSSVGAEQATRQAILGGADMIQLREPDLPDSKLLKLSLSIKKICEKSGVPLIINNRPDIALIVDAAGVHIGQNDLPIKAVRSIVGAGKIVGVSTHTAIEAENAVKDGADYIGVGPIFETKTKKINKTVGLELIRQTAKNTSVPFYPIGGIGRENIDDIIKAGARRAAICSAIISSDKIKESACYFKRKLSQ